MEIKFQGQYDKDTIFKALKLANKPSKRNSFICLAILIALIIIAISYKESLFVY